MNESFLSTTVSDALFLSKQVLHRSVEVVQLFAGLLKRLRLIADADAAKFRSEGFTRLFNMLTKELSDEYLSIVEDHLRRLAFCRGILMSAELDKGNKGTNCVLRKPRHERRSWIGRLQGWMERRLSFVDRSRYVYENRPTR